MINIADVKEKTGVNLGERPVPYYEQPVGIIPVPEGRSFDYISELENVFVFFGNLDLGLKIFCKRLQCIEKNNKIFVSDCLLYITLHAWSMFNN
jgi:hypothetical protein